MTYNAFRKLFFALTVFSVALSFEFNTAWGQCTIINNELVLSNNEIKKIVLKKIKKLHSQFKLKNHTSSFSIIIADEKEKINHKYWDWSIGITFSNPEKIIIKNPAFAHISLKRFQQVLEHELNHIMINRVDKNKTIPRWFKEGFAMYFSDEISLQQKLEIANHINNKNLFNILDLETFKNFDKERYTFAYSQSAIYVLYIEDFFGMGTLNKIFLDMQNGNTFQNAFYANTSKTLEEFNELSYPFIKNKLKWYKLITLSNKLFVFFPLLLIIGFLMKSINNKKIEARWKIEEEIEELNK